LITAALVLALAVVWAPTAGADDVADSPATEAPADTTPPDPPAETAPPETAPPETAPPDTTPPDTEPPTTAPDTEPPTTEPPSTTTPETTTPGGATTTTGPSSSPDPTTTTVPGEVPRLDPSEPLTPRPEFASLSPRVRTLIDVLQRATDVYAIRRFAWLDLARQVPPAEAALAHARTAEQLAVAREVIGLVTASTDDDVHAARRGNGDRASRAAKRDRLNAFRAEKRRLVADRKDTRSERMYAEAVFTDLKSRFDTLTREVFDAASVREAAESALEQELGPEAARARADGIAFTLALRQAGQPVPTLLGGIATPILGARLSSPFGLRNDPLGGGAGFHSGVDLAARTGTPIRAVADGTVVTAGDCGGYGNCVIIDHGVSLATLYGHQSVVLVAEGQPVVAGQVIGLVGSTGKSTGPHLHFELRLNGIPIDPLLALAPS
jgi:murein DD-endopeptidase MepM/ murein hydrolase activator NlpD